MTRGSDTTERISTHSLTRRLTEHFHLHSLLFGISTHSLTRRLTDNGVFKGWVGRNFNSQPHKEADLHCNVWFSA